MVAVRKVQASNVHAGVKHLDEHVNVPAGRAKSADDLGLTLVEVDLLKNVLEANVARVGAASVCCLYHLYSFWFFQSLCFVLGLV